MTNPSIRARFAPAPTGFMHLGNVRTALMNYLFTRQKHGVLILRVEDTDQERNFDPGAKQILEDLAWLGITYEEGPGKGGPHAPYFQSERMPIYREWLDRLIDTGSTYRCFCTAEELEKKRLRQIDLKLPPRYDRTCLNLSPDMIKQKQAEGIPYIWRFKLDAHDSVTITDIARGEIRFDLKNFSDFPLARQDGTYTFMFANCVDDISMGITHIFRGEDHLSNTASQAALFRAFNAPLPYYWHMPILFNIEGKKLSKRDFGFSLIDLRAAGYLPEAICNYLATIGGGNFDKHDVTRGLSLQELARIINFDHLSATGQIRYDVEKLRSLNHIWIMHYEPYALTKLCMPYLLQSYPQTEAMDINALTTMIQALKTDLITLADIVPALHFFFARPATTLATLHTHIEAEQCAIIASLIHKHLSLLATPDQFMTQVKQDAQHANISLKLVYMYLRLKLMGQPHGPSIIDLIKIIGEQEAKERLIA